MNEPALLANKNLIVNGGFESNLDGWTLTEPDKGIAAQEQDPAGTPIWHLKLVNGGVAKQSFHVPVKPQPAVRYRLKFDFQSTQGSICKVVINPGSGPERSYDLVSSSLLNDPEPFVLYLQPFEQEIVFFTVEEQQVEIRFVTPRNSGQPHRGLRLTNVRVEVLLDPLQLDSLKLDGIEAATSGPVFLCRGAGLAGTEPHQLSVQVQTDSPWRGTQVSLLLDGSTDGDVTSQPTLGVEQSIDLGWQLSCVDIDEPEKLHSLGIRSEYTAAIYPVKARLGNYRLELEVVAEASYFPVVALDEDVTLTVRVKSYYTQKPMANRKVTWTLGKVILHEIDTNAQGDATFTFKPNSTHGGLQKIVASVESLYYPQDASLTLDVRVLLLDPWNTIKLQLDDTGEFSWGGQAGYPNRGGSHQLKLILPADHPFADTHFALNWLPGGDSPQILGVDFAPALETLVPWAGPSMVWSMTAADKRDGQYSLLLRCSRLKTASRANLMKLAHNWLKKGETKISTKYPVVEEGASALLSLQVKSKMIDVDAPGVIVSWKVAEQPVKEQITGANGWSEYSFKPTTVEPAKITAQVKSLYDDSEFSEVFELTPVMSNPWVELTELSMRDMPLRPDVGIVCLLNEEGTLKLESTSAAFSGELIHLELSDTSQELGLVFDPPLGQKRPLNYEQALEWKIKSSALKGGRFTLMVCCEGVLSEWPVEGRLISKNLADEATLAFDQFRIDPAQGGYPCVGMHLPFVFQYVAGSALVGLNAKLVWEGQTAAELKIIVNPLPGVPVELTAEGARWSLDCRQSVESGEFKLKVCIPDIGLEFVYGPFAMTLGHHRVKFADVEREAIIDPVVADQERVGLALQILSQFTQRPVNGVSVMWKGTSDGQATSVPGDRNGWSSYLYLPKTAGPHNVSAELTSLFDSECHSRAMTVTALAYGVWNNVDIQIDSEAAGTWGTKTAFPRRGQRLAVTLKLKDATKLPVNTYLQLGWRGTGAAELGVTVDSALGTKRLLTAQGLTWTFTFSNTSGLSAGSFSLLLVAERVLAIAPENSFTINASTSAQSEDGLG